MGILNVRKISNYEDRQNYIRRLLNDIKLLESLIKEEKIEKKPIRIGAEQEFCLTDNFFKPKLNAIELLNEINDKNFTTEIGKYNLELNLDPIELQGNCFKLVAKQLYDKMNYAAEIASKLNTNIVLSGILPTLTTNHIELECMTPINRNFVLNDAIMRYKKQNFYIHIKGIDEINIKLNTIMLEGCNTSFQIHLQISPDEFIDQYNWAQAISGPILSVCCNSPLLFGKELWHETRIALFTQSVDTRFSSYTLNTQPTRVGYGFHWQRGTIADIYKESVSYFRSFITSDDIKSKIDIKDISLKGLNLHNGTIYQWNRACYGVGNGLPHLRIENRYLPAGPSLIDQVANMTFWIGVMIGKDEKYKQIADKMDFKSSKSNFYKAARYGLDTQFDWFGKRISSDTMIENILLPMAEKGLKKIKIDQDDIDFYLSIVRKRLNNHTGAEWKIKNYRKLLDKYKPFEASQLLTSRMYEYQLENIPICQWKNIKVNTIISVDKQKTVKHIVNDKIITADKQAPIEMIKKMMKWNNINHLPIITNSRKLLGLITQKLLDENSNFNGKVEDLMYTKLLTIDSLVTIEQAKTLMKQHQTDYLLVVKKKKLIGILTSKDFS